MRYLKLSFILLNLIVSSAHAQLVGNSLDAQSGTLPKGRFMIGYNGMGLKLNSQFNDQGQYRNFYANNSLDFKVQNLINEEKNNKQLVEALFQSYGLKSTDEIGEYRFNVDGVIKANVFTVGYGITDSIGLFVTVPYLKWNARIESYFRSSEKFKSMLNELVKEDQIQTASDLNKGTQEGLNYALDKNGMSEKNLTSEGQNIGDIQVNLKISQFKFSRADASLDPFLVLPTASQISRTDVIPLATGERRLGLGVGSNLVYYNNDILRSGFQTSYKYLFKSKNRVRSPLSSSSEVQDINFDVDDGAQLKNGSEFNIHVNQSITFHKAMTYSAGLDYVKKFRTEFSGTQLSPNAYDILSEQSERSLFTAHLGLNYNSIDSFLRSQFPIPLQLGLNFQFPLAGANTFAEPALTTQIYTFF